MQPLSSKKAAENNDSIVNGRETPGSKSQLRKASNTPLTTARVARSPVDNDVKQNMDILRSDSLYLL